MCEITQQDIYDVLTFYRKAILTTKDDNNKSAFKIYMKAYKNTIELLEETLNQLNKPMAKNLKVNVRENTNVNLKYPHLKQSIDYTGLIILFSTKTSGTIISTGEHNQFTIGKRHNDLKPEAFKTFTGIIELTQ